MCEHGGNADSCGRVDQLTRLLQHRQLLTHYIKINKIKRNIWEKKKEIKKKKEFSNRVSLIGGDWLLLLSVARFCGRRRGCEIFSTSISPSYRSGRFFPHFFYEHVSSLLKYSRLPVRQLFFPLRRIVNHPNLKSFKKILDLGRALMNLLSRITFFEISFSFLNVYITRNLEFVKEMFCLFKLNIFSSFA